MIYCPIEVEIKIKIHIPPDTRSTLKTPDNVLIIFQKAHIAKSKLDEDIQ